MHDFNERLAFSEGQTCTVCCDHIVSIVAAAHGYERANGLQDRNGTDYWILRKHGLPSLSIDFKNRSFCCIEKFGVDDACIETTSVYQGTSRPPFDDEFRIKPGWTLDETKRSDYVVYTWPKRDKTLRYWIVPFPFLQAAAIANWRIWADKYSERAAMNDGYVTLSVFVPRREIATAARKYMYSELGQC